MSRLETAPSAEAEPFWEASRERRLVLPWCTSCNRAHWFPRAICPHCGGRTFDWREALGPAPTLVEVLSTFLALLELAKRGLCRVSQDSPFASLVISRELAESALAAS